MDKVFIDANTLFEKSFGLAKQIWDSGYHPDIIVGIWRGGTPPGIAIHEFMKVKGRYTPYHTAIKTQAYGEGDDGAFGIVNGVAVKGLDHVIDVINSEDRMLLVDDVFDTGVTMREVLDIIRKKARKNCPEIRIATVYYKPENNKTEIVPDFYVVEDNRWLVFPHELDGLTEDEIRTKSLKVHKLLYGK